VLKRLRQLIQSSPVRKEPPRRDIVIHLDGVAEPVKCLFNDRARRYRLGLDRAGNPRLTIPRRGSLSEAQRFAQQQVVWLKQQIQRRAASRQRQMEYASGDAILFRGELQRYDVAGSSDGLLLQFAGENIPITENLHTDRTARREAVLRWMRALAARELPVRTQELASLHGLEVARVSVRNQRTRWGSCSNRRGISLNWRLVQVPEFARDYIILHELMHLREMNHSKRYWKLVSNAFPDYQKAESWLKANNGILSSGD
jgi:predicted metal-dependent hydrolase